MSKFKVGDKVRIYESNRLPSVGIVENITHDGNLFVHVKAVGKSEYGTIVHPKQCRRLVKKKKPKSFNLGDRVKFYVLGEFFKGTVIQIFPNRKLILIKQDHPIDTNDDGFIAKTEDCIKLVKKKKNISRENEMSLQQLIKYLRLELYNMRREIRELGEKINVKV